LADFSTSPRGWNSRGFHSKNILFPIRQILTADFERVSTVCVLARLSKNTKRLVSPNKLSLAFIAICNSRKIHILTSEFHVKFYLKNKVYRTHLFTNRSSLNFSFEFFVLHIMLACNLFCLFRPCKQFFSISSIPLL